MKLELDSDNVLRAASACPEAKKILRILFPKVFEEETPCIGQHYCKGRDVYVVAVVTEAQPKHKYALININYGARYTQESTDLNEIFGQDRASFKLIRWSRMDAQSFEEVEDA